jgi:hypothetical protein
MMLLVLKGLLVRRAVRKTMQTAVHGGADAARNVA